MSDRALFKLAQQAGLTTEWEDFRGHRQQVSAATLSALLAALDLPAASPAQIADSRARIDAEVTAAALPPLVTADIDAPIALPGSDLPASGWRLELESGDIADVRIHTDAEGRQWLPAIATGGYHRLIQGNRELVLAVAPRRCFGIEDLSDAAHRGNRRWGLGCQIYGLRSADDGGIGDFTGLAAIARSAAAQGADALALSPVHALFAADAHHFSPYAPSSRLFLNALHADPATLLGREAVRRLLADSGADGDLGPLRATLEAQALIDWPTAARAKQQLLRRAYRAMAAELAGGLTPLAQDFHAFVSAGGEALRDHARFEALHAQRFGADPAQWHWRNWPGALRDAGGAAVAAFARDHADEVRYHLFLQWLADHGLHRAQEAARAAGMSVGLIADLAVGTDNGGSYAWSRPHELLASVSVGAPPDLLNLQGQNWGLTALSPRALRRSGYAPFVALLRANLRRVGGLRIDHVLGLRRLWIVPNGADAGAGAYLRYPLTDLLRLVALESWRHRAIVIGEDLGTVPAGFQQRLSDAGVLGMRVLWFERDHGLFINPKRWSHRAMATTSTHDLPTVAGWWQGREIDWRADLDLFTPADDEAATRSARSADRAALWAAFRHAGLGADDCAPSAPEPVVDAAIAYVGRSPAPLVMVPVEDALGLVEQPNLPGTTTGHPNWCRRLPAAADAVLETPRVRARLAALDRARHDG